MRRCMFHLSRHMLGRRTAELGRCVALRCSHVLKPLLASAMQSLPFLMFLMLQNLQ